MPKLIIRDVIAKTPDAQWIGDLDATAAWAASAAKGDLNRLGVMGWCRGGRDVWLYAAHRRDLKAAVAWYGPVGGERTRHPAADRGRRGGGDQRAAARPLRGADTGIPVAAVEEARDRAKAAGKSVELVIYPDAPHGFHADYRPSYRREAAEDGWRSRAGLPEGARRRLNNRNGRRSEAFVRGCVAQDTATTSRLCKDQRRICACAGPARRGDSMR